MALEAIKGLQTINEIARQFEVHPDQVSKWKKQMLERLPQVFSDKSWSSENHNREKDMLYQQIGQLQVEFTWLKKRLISIAPNRRIMIDMNHSRISIQRQCELAAVNRSGYYYEPVTESELNLTLMRLIDEQYTRTPFYGSPRMTQYLRYKGYFVNYKRV